MKLSALKASALDALPHVAHTPAQIIEWAQGGRFNDPEGRYLLTIEHHGVTFKVGRYAGLGGRYWLVEAHTEGISFGSLELLKMSIRVRTFLALGSSNVEGPGHD